MKPALLLLAALLVALPVGGQAPQERARILPATIEVTKGNVRILMFGDEQRTDIAVELSDSAPKEITGGIVEVSYNDTRMALMLNSPVLYRFEVGVFHGYRGVMEAVLTVPVINTEVKKVTVTLTKEVAVETWEPVKP